MSPCTPVTRPPIALTAVLSLSWRRPVMNTDAPSAANACAAARPIPLVPPVTTTTLLSNLPIVLFLCRSACAAADVDACRTIRTVDRKYATQRSPGGTMRTDLNDFAYFAEVVAHGGFSA